MWHKVILSLILSNLQHDSSAGGSLEECKVLGTSYNPKGEVEGVSASSTPSLELFAATCTLCNDSNLQYLAETDKYERQGICSY